MPKYFSCIYPVGMSPVTKYFFLALRKSNPVFAFSLENRGVGMEWGQILLWLPDEYFSGKLGYCYFAIFIKSFHLIYIFTCWMFLQFVSSLSHFTTGFQRSSPEQVSLSHSPHILILFYMCSILLIAYSVFLKFQSLTVLFPCLKSPQHRIH